MKKFVKKLLSITLIISAITLTGCSEKKLVQDTNVAMGNYIAEEIDFPENDEDYLVKNYLVQGDTGDLYCYAIKDECKVYSLTEEDEWQIQRQIKLPDEIRKIYKIFTKEGKLYIAYGDKEANMCMAIQQTEDDFKIIRFNKDKQPIKEKASNKFAIDIDSNGDIYMGMIVGIGKIQKYNGQTGDWLKEFTEDIQDFVVIEDEIYGVRSGDRVIKVCSNTTGDVIRTINYSGGGAIKLVKGFNDSDLYMCNSNGIFHLNKDGVLWEQVVTGDKLAKIDSEIIDYTLYISKDSFIIYYYRNNGDMLVQYYYDKDMVSNPAKQIGIFMIEDDKVLRKAAKIYQEEHKDTMVQSQSVVRGDRYIFNGLDYGKLQNEGMDLIELEGTANCIREGELADITDVVQKLIDDGVIDEKIANNFKIDGRYYVIPTRYKVGTIWGNREILSQVNTIEDLAAYKKAHPEQILFGKTKLELAYQFSSSWVPSCFDKTGKFNEEKYRAFLESITALEEKEYASINEDQYCYELSLDKKKKKEILDVAEGKAQLVILAPDSLDEAAEAAETLNVRNDIMVKNLMGLDDTTIYGVGGILGINASSESKDAAKEIIEITLSDDMQRLNSEKGMPINKKVQEENNTNLMAYQEIYDEFKGCVEQVDFCVNNIDNLSYHYILFETDKYCTGEQTMEEAISAIKSKVKDIQDINHYHYKSAALN